MSGAAVSEDYTTIVDHCTRLLAEDPAIEYVVLTRKDGFSLAHNRSGWLSEHRDGMWLPKERVAAGHIRSLASENKSVL